MAQKPGSKKGRLTPEEAKRWFDSLSPEQVEERVAALFRCAANGYLEGEGELTGQLNVIPTTPDRIQRFESELNATLESQSRDKTTGMQAAHPDYKPVAEHFLNVDRQLGPGPWQDALRNWARRVTKELFDGPVTTLWEEFARYALEGYVGDMETAEREAHRITPKQAKGWYESLSPEEADKQAFELLGTAVQDWHKLTDAQIEQLKVVPLTPERVQFFESKLSEWLEQKAKSEIRYIEVTADLFYITGILGKGCNLSTPEAEALRATPEYRQRVESELRNPETWAHSVRDIADNIERLGDVLNPQTWRPVLRKWAKQRAEQIALGGTAERCEKMAVDALNQYRANAK